MNKTNSQTTIHRFLLSNLAVAFALALAAVIITPCAEAGPRAGTAPPHSHAFGNDLQEWMNAFWVSNLGGGEDQMVGHVTLLTVPEGSPTDGDGSEGNPLVLVGERDVEMMVGSPFALGVLAWAGESYVQEECPDDEPLAPDLFLEADVLITVDGHPLIDSDHDDLGDYYYEATEFDPPIVYDEPANRGDCDADAAIWVQGLGFLHGPLTPGEHTLVLDATADFLGFHVRFINTWNITVSK